MADNFSDDTLDDFFQEHDLFELANLALPLPLPTAPSLSFGAPPLGSLTLESPAFPPFGARRNPREAPVVHSAGLVSRPAPPLGASHRPTPTAPRRPEPGSGLDPFSTRSFVQSPIPPPPFLPATATTSNHSVFSPHSLFRRPSLRPEISRTPLRTQSPPRDLAGAFSTRLDRTGVAAQPVTQRETPILGADGRSAASASSMSSARGRFNRDLRPGDLTMPTLRSGTQTGPSSGSAAASSSATQRRVSRPSSQRVALPFSARKRKREEDEAKPFKCEKDDDDLFGDASFADHDVVDLVDKDEVPAEILNNSQKFNNFAKLSAFNCVICMDEVTNLTVTHCGHLFCSECLHSALHIDPHKRICPICRQKIDKLPASGKFSQKAKGFYPLELKLMTRKTLGKKPARP